LTPPPAALYLSVRSGDLARVDVSGGELVVRPRGLVRLWAVKNEVRVPLADVASVRLDVDRRQVPSGWRVPGTYVPGVIQAGTYRRRGEKSFWLVGRTRRVTVIECRPGSRYDRIVLQVAGGTAARLAGALPQGS